MGAKDRGPVARALLRVALLALAGIYPFAVAYGAFAGVQPLDSRAVWRAAAASWGLTAGAYGISRIFVAEGDALALCLSVELIACTVYAMVANGLATLGVPVVGANVWVAMGYVGLVACVTVLVVRPWRRAPRDLVPFMLVALTLVGVNMYYGVAREWRLHGTGWPQAARGIMQAPAIAPRIPVNAHPDIYFIVLDALGRPDILREYYDLDVSDFVDFLHARGFYLPSDVRSNYAQTLLSFSSFLNLGYLDPMADLMGPKNVSWTPLGDLIRGNALMRLASDAGYHVTAVGSDFEPLKRFSQAEVCVCGQYGMDIFELAVLSQTPFGTLPIDPWTYGAHRRRILDEFSALEHLPPGPSPRFVFAHIMAPHPPFTFAPDGAFHRPDRGFSFNEGSDFLGTHAEYVQGYRDQAQFVFARLRTVVDAILDRPGPRPVIVIEGDHGPGSRLSQQDAAHTDLRERMSPFAAYEFPNGPDGLYASMTLVNGTRALANGYLGTTLPPLPDVSRFSTGDIPFDFTPVPAEPAEVAALSHAAP